MPNSTRFLATVQRTMARLTGKCSLPAVAATFALALSAYTHDVKPRDSAAAVMQPKQEEPVNRAIFAFNRTLDSTVIRPVARGYSHLPHPVRNGVRNFAQNLQEPLVFANDLLQGNMRRSINTAARFVVNSTVGIVGVFDVAERWNMPHHEADLGQTFGVWGVGPGHTVELPLFGSSNVRDAAGRILTMGLNTMGDNSRTVQTLRTAGTVGRVVDGRARSLPITDRMEHSPDYYAAIRDFAAKRRAALVEDGRTGNVHSAETTLDGRAANGLPFNP